MLQYTVQGAFVFLGQRRRPREIITPAELVDAIESNRTTQQAIDSLVSLGYLVPSEEGAKSTTERLDALEAGQAATADKLDRVLALLGQGSASRGAAKKRG